MQEAQYVVYYFLYVNNILIPECYKTGDLVRTVDTLDITKAPQNGLMWRRKLQTSIIEATPIEFEMYKRKDNLDQAVIYKWEKERNQRTCKLIETDAGANPLVALSVANTWDLGKCEISSVTDVGSDRTSAAAGVVKFTINPEYIKQLL